MGCALDVNASWASDPNLQAKQIATNKSSLMRDSVVESDACGDRHAAAPADGCTTFDGARCTPELLTIDLACLLAYVVSLIWS